VQKIIGVSIGEGNVRNYQVQWAPTWISGIQLVGCEHLIEEFMHQQPVKSVFLNGNGTTTNTMDQEHLQHNNIMPRKLYRDQFSGSHERVSTTTNGNHLVEKQVNPCLSVDNNGCNGDVKVIPIEATNVKKRMCTSNENEANKTNPNFEWAEKSIGDVNREEYSSNDKSLTLARSDELDHNYDKNSKNNKSDDISLIAQLLHANKTFIKREHEPQGNEVDMVGVNKPDNVNAADSTDNNNIRQESAEQQILGYECDICHKLFQSKLYLRSHIEISHSKNIHMRDQRCVSKISFGSHNSSHANITKHTFPCSFCTKSFYTNTLLKRHMVTHTGERFQCDFCELTFKRKDSVIRHTRQRHKST